jgi:uncharacterized iron-regulated membrane protein
MSPRDSSASAALSRRGSAGLWFAVFGGPLAWTLGLTISYFAVHEVCRVGSPWLPRIVSFVTWIVALAAAVTGRIIWVRADRAEAERAHPAAARTRFLAQIGVLGGSVFSLIMLLQIVATFVVSPCHDRPRTPDSPDVRRSPPAAERTLA